MEKNPTGQKRSRERKCADGGCLLVAEDRGLNPWVLVAWNCWFWLVKPPSFLGTLKTQPMMIRYIYIYIFKNETLKRLGVLQLDYFLRNGYGQIILWIETFKNPWDLLQNRHPGLLKRETLLNQSFPPKKLEHKLKHADKPSMFLEVSQRCFQHAFDSIDVCAKLDHAFGMFGFIPSCGSKMPPSFNIVRVAWWDW